MTSGTIDTIALVWFAAINAVTFVAFGSTSGAQGASVGACPNRRSWG